VIASYQMAGDFGVVAGPVTAGYLVDAASYGAAFGLAAGSSPWPPYSASSPRKPARAAPRFLLRRVPNPLPLASASRN
jgi:MFS family permease